MDEVGEMQYNIECLKKKSESHQERVINTMTSMNEMISNLTLDVGSTVDCNQKPEHLIKQHTGFEEKAVAAHHWEDLECQIKTNSTAVGGTLEMENSAFSYNRRTSKRIPTSKLKQQVREELETAILSHAVDGLSVVELEHKGRGVIAVRKFRKGEFLVEYEGDLVDVKTAKDREEQYENEKHAGCYMYYFSHNETKYCIDATAESGKIGRLLNHSKSGPNCLSRLIVIDDHPHIFFIAARNINIGEELVYDYGDRNKEAVKNNPWLSK